MAIYNSIQIPLEIFYKDAQHSALKGNAINAINAFVDLIFLIDIIITFRTTFLDPAKSMEETDPHTIAIRYLKG